jgi:hypothetical protein
MSQVKIEYRDPKDLIPYVNNTRTHSDEQITTLASMIAEFGFDVPIVVDSKNVIIKGHGRRLASLKLALKQVPVIVRDDLAPIEVKAARVADNRAGELSGWDNELLKIEFESLQLNDYNLDFTGFNSNDLSGLLAGFNNDEENGTEFQGSQVIGDNVNNNVVGSTEEENNNVLDSQYSHKIDAPIYEPSEDKPLIQNLYNDTRYNELINDIQESNITKEEKEFLIKCATRHIVFNYQDIADFYAHSNKEVQSLMEDSALVIIDFDKALRLGYVKLKEEIANQYLEDYGDE